MDQNNSQFNNSGAEAVAASISALPRQIKDIFAQAEKIQLPEEYRKINKVVVNGMGGSNLGARIIASVLKNEIKVPILIEPGYSVPAYVDQETLYIISSYSGNTEEPLSAFAEAKNQGAKIIGLTAKSEKNKLTELIASENIPGFIFSSEFNPSGQPRLGLGYAIFALVTLLYRAGVIKIDQAEIEQAISLLEKNDSQLNPNSSEDNNTAKKAAQELFDREIILAGAGFLEGNLHALRNQFCENSKNFANYLVVPEMNHYALEGLSYPARNRENLAFVFFLSELYHARDQRRCQLTQEVAQKQGIKTIELKLTGPTRLIQATEMLQLGCWITFYLALLNQIDPITIPWVDWFKKELA